MYKLLLASASALVVCAGIAEAKDLNSIGITVGSLGNPFFVTEMLRHGHSAVPHAVQDVVLARLSNLAAPAQAICPWASGRGSPAATRNCHSTRSRPVTASVTGCST